MTKNVEFTYDICTGAPVAKVWKGIVDGEMTRHYVIGARPSVARGAGPAPARSA
jgi:hypothetical protein